MNNLSRLVRDATGVNIMFKAQWIISKNGCKVWIIKFFKWCNGHTKIDTVRTKILHWFGSQTCKGLINKQYKMKLSFNQLKCDWKLFDEHSADWKTECYSVKDNNLNPISNII